MDRNYVDINPNRRTAAAIGFAQPGTALYHEIVDQEKLPSFYSMDLHAGKNIQLSRMSRAVNKVSKNTYLNVNLGVSNLLNNTHIISYGFEQLRYDFTGNNPNMFSSKYLYAMGLNFFLNVTLRF
jgi:outer membrane receptor protein involved in Fe transport